MSVPKNSNVKLLACVVDCDDAIILDGSDYRFLVDGKFVKYVKVAPEALPGDNRERTWGPVLLGDLLPPFPSGNWNQGYVDKDPETGEIAFITTETEVLPEVENIWHPVKMKEMDFSQSKRVKQHVHVATNPGFHDGQPVLIKFAVWLEEIPRIEKETTIYQYIHEKGIGPGFLGHITEGPGENGRVIGLITEWVPDARPAELGDLEGCKKALARLHELGIKLGDTNRFNFLVREGHEVVLIDFEVAEKCSPEELEAEMNGLEERLADGIHNYGAGVISERL